MEIEKILLNRLHPVEVSQEIHQWVSGFLEKQGDGLKGGHFLRVKPDQFEIKVWTESDIEFSKRFPVSLPPAELMSKVRHWFIQDYKKRKTSPIDISDIM